MKVGVVSDSHGNLPYLKKAAQRLKKERVEIIIHLGDDYDDAKLLSEYCPKLIRIPGVFSSYYHDPRIPNRLIQEFGAFKVLLSHTSSSHPNDLPQDPKPEKLIANKQVDVVFYGHTHIPTLEIKEGLLWINPGHLKSEDKKGHSPSFAVVDFQGQNIKAGIFDVVSQDLIKSIEYVKS